MAMRETKKKQVIILSDLDSPYFEQTILILKKDASANQDRLVEEARRIVQRYILRYEACLSPQKKKTFQKVLPWVLGGMVLCAVCILLFL